MPFDRCRAHAALLVLLLAAPVRAGDITVDDPGPPPPAEFGDGIIDFAESALLGDLTLWRGDVVAASGPIGLQASEHLSLLSGLSLTGQSLELSAALDLEVLAPISGAALLFLQAQGGHVHVGPAADINASGATTITGISITFDAVSAQTGGSLMFGADTILGGTDLQSIGAASALTFDGDLSRTTIGDVLLSAGTLIVLNGSTATNGDITLAANARLRENLASTDAVTFNGNALCNGPIGQQIAAQGGPLTISGGVQKTGAGDLLLVSPLGITVNGEATSNQALTFDGAATLRHTVFVQGDLSFLSDVTFDGPDQFVQSLGGGIAAARALLKSSAGNLLLAAATDVVVQGPVEIQAGQLFVDGDATFGADVTVQGGITLMDGVTFDGDGDQRAEAPFGSMTVTGPVAKMTPGALIIAAAGTVDVASGAAALGGALTFEGQTVVGQDLLAQGDLSILGTALFDGSSDQRAESQAGQLWLLGAAEKTGPGDLVLCAAAGIDASAGGVSIQVLAGGLRIESDAFVAGAISVYGSLIANGTLQVTGDIDAGGNVSLNGPASLGGDLTSGADVTVASPVSFDSAAAQVIFAGGGVIVNEVVSKPQNDLRIDATGPTFLNADVVVQNGLLRVNGPAIVESDLAAADDILFLDEVTFGGGNTLAGRTCIFGGGSVSIAPGATGGVVVVGAVSLDPLGTLYMDLGTAGLSAGTPVGDLIVVSGSITLSGTLRLSLVGDYEPSADDEIDLVLAAQVVGAFSDVRGLKGVEIIYEPGRIFARIVNACPADLSGNGSIDILDLLMLFGDWGTCGGCAADLDDDGFVDGIDLKLLLGGWGPCS